MKMFNNTYIKQTKFGWVDLSQIDRNNQSFRWRSSVGAHIPFQYNDIVSEMIIVDADPTDCQYVYIDIPAYVARRRIYVGQIKNGQIGALLSVIVREFRYDVGDIVNGLEILRCCYGKSHRKYYEYRCTVDGYCGSAREDHIMDGHGCPVCSGRIAMRGVNDIATTRPDVADMLVNADDKYRYTDGSNQKAYFECPNCGQIIYAYIRDVSRRGGVLWPMRRRNFISE